MSKTNWRVSYTDRDGKKGEVVIESTEKPLNEQAAILIRKHLLGDDFMLIDTPRGHVEPTVLLLQHYGYEITTIEEVPDPSPLQPSI